MPHVLIFIFILGRDKSSFTLCSLSPTDFYADPLFNLSLKQTTGLLKTHFPLIG